MIPIIDIIIKMADHDFSDVIPIYLNADEMKETSYEDDENYNEYDSKPSCSIAPVIGCAIMVCCMFALMIIFIVTKVN